MKQVMSPKQWSGCARTVLSRRAKVITLSVIIVTASSAAAFAQCCGGPPPELSGSGAGPVSTSGVLPAIPVLDSQNTLSFTVPTISGSDFSLQSVRGKPTVLYFMAYWCPTCVPEARALGELYRKYGNRISIVALDVDPSSTPTLLERFRSLAGNPGYTFALDSGDRVARALGVRYLETNVFVDSAGSIAGRVDHSLGFADLSQEVEKLLR